MSVLTTGQNTLGLYSCIFNSQTLQVVECSDALARVLGLDAGQDLVGRFVLDVFQPDSYEAFGHFIQSGRFEEGIMCNLSRPSGAGLRVVMGIAQPGVREDELLTLYCLTVEDHQPKIQALLARNEVLAQQNERLKSFTGIVAHDLANALQTVATGITMLQPQLSDSLSTNDRQKFHRIAQASQAMRDILSGMMMYLRFEIGEYPMELTSLNALVDTIITSTIEPPGKTLSIRRCAELPALVCERHLIEELFRNVVGNSIKYCDKEQIEIEIGLEPAFGPDPVFFIRDNGVGIHENDLTRVFEPFCRADRQGLNVSGNGMGMMLVQSIVTRHGGAVWLESTVHLGTTVRFSLSTQPQARI